MERRRNFAVWAALLALAVLLAACSAGGPGGDKAARARGPLMEPPPPSAPGAASREPERAAPPGVYLLHEEGYGLDACVYVGERTTGESAPLGRPAAEEKRARAALDLAAQARWMGGNVVMLPNFREDFRSGHLQGRVYRCGEAERRAIYARAAKEQKLTVIEP